MSLKQLLAEKYVGAIIIAFLWSRAITELINLIMMPISQAITRSSEPAIQFGEGTLVAGVSVQIISMVIRFAIGYALARWIYRDETAPVAEIPA